METRAAAKSASRYRKPKGDILRQSRGSLGADSHERRLRDIDLAGHADRHLQTIDGHQGDEHDGQNAGDIEAHGVRNKNKREQQSREPRRLRPGMNVAAFSREVFEANAGREQHDALQPLDDFPAEEALRAEQQNADHDHIGQNLRAHALGERIDITDASASPTPMMAPASSAPRTDSIPPSNAIGSARNPMP